MGGALASSVPAGRPDTAPAPAPPYGAAKDTPFTRRHRIVILTNAITSLYTIVTRMMDYGLYIEDPKIEVRPLPPLIGWCCSFWEKSVLTRALEEELRGPSTRETDTPPRRPWPRL